MAASRKLQGEIDRVLKKVQEGVELFDNIWNKVYDTDNVNQKEKYEAELKKEIKKLQRYRDQIKTWIQSSEIKDKKALMDARRQIEREMERFKICEKETKTKAFSKEGLGQQPKTDPKEKAKSETRDWINNVVGELESQVDAFEAEIEGLTVKKGKTRPPRLTHLETSITRHKAHIMKLELILRLLENEELSPEQVNDVKDFLDDYVERNQDDFDEFSDVDELYSSLPLEKVEALEDLVAIGPTSHVKGAKPQTVGSASSSVLKTSAASSSQTTGVVSPPQQSASEPEQIEELASVNNNSDAATRTPKSSAVSSSTLTNPAGSHTNSVPLNVTANVAGTPIASTASPSPVTARAALENEGPSVPAPLNIASAPTEDDALSFPGRRSSPALTDTGVVGGIGTPGISGQPTNLPHGSSATVPSNGITLGSVSMVSDATRRNVIGADEKVASSGTAQSSVTSSLVAAGRTFSSTAPGMQWRPGSSFQSSNEMVQFRGRAEIAPDQREKFLQRLQQVQQQGPGNLLGMQTLGGGNHSQYPGQQQNPLQLNSQSSALPSQVALGLGARAPGLNTAMSASLQQQSAPIPPQAAHEGPLSSGPKVSDGSLAFVEEQQHNLSDDAAAEAAIGAVNKTPTTDTDLKASFSKDVPTGSLSGPLTELGPFQRDTDLSPGQALQSSHPTSLGVIGRRSVSDLGAIGDNLGPTIASPGGMHDQLYNYKMLESAFHKLPQPKDSERPRTYNPRHPAVTPPSYPQVQAPVVNNPAFWERIAYMNENPDILFFAFYYQQNTYQQYLAAKQLKKQAWRFHRKYNTWFQRHEEPEEATDDHEKGSYVYFDFHVGEDEKGWCQRIRQDFTFEYNFLEDELMA